MIRFWLRNAPNYILCFNKISFNLYRCVVSKFFYLLYLGYDDDVEHEQQRRRYCAIKYCCSVVKVNFASKFRNTRRLLTLPIFEIKHVQVAYSENVHQGYCDHERCSWVLEIVFQKSILQRESDSHESVECEQNENKLGAEGCCVIQPCENSASPSSQVVKVESKTWQPENCSLKLRIFGFFPLTLLLPPPVATRLLAPPPSSGKQTLLWLAKCHSRVSWNITHRWLFCASTMLLRDISVGGGREGVQKWSELFISCNCVIMSLFIYYSKFLGLCKIYEQVLKGHECFL